MKSPLSLTAGVAALAITTLLTAYPIHAYSTPATDAAAPIAKGVKWLVEHQAEDGSFSNPQFPGLSGLALWAVAASGDPAYAKAVRKGSDFLLGNVQPDGGIYTVIPGRKGGGLSTYNTAISLTALVASGRDDITEVVLNARTFLANSQHIGDDPFDGGFGYDKSTDRAYTDLMNTHFVIESMRRSQSFEDKRPAGQKRADINWSQALKYAESLHNGPDTGDNAGGFVYNPSDAKAGIEKKAEGTLGLETEGGEKIIMRSYGSITYAGLLSLIYCEVDKTDPRVQSALDWASKHWTLEENPGMGDQGLYFFYNVMGRAMSTVGMDSIPRKSGPAIQWNADLIAKVASLQAEDGSWVNKNGRFWENDPVLATAYAVLSLEFASGTTK